MQPNQKEFVLPKAYYQGHPLPWYDLYAASMDHFAQAAQLLGAINHLNDINLIFPDQVLTLATWMIELCDGKTTYTVQQGDTLNHICATIMQKCFQSHFHFSILIRHYNASSHTITDQGMVVNKTQEEASPLPLRFPHWTNIPSQSIPPEGISVQNLYAQTIHWVKQQPSHYWPFVQIHNVNTIPYARMHELSPAQLTKIQNSQLRLPCFNNTNDIVCTSNIHLENTEKIMQHTHTTMLQSPASLRVHAFSTKLTQHIPQRNYKLPKTILFALGLFSAYTTTALLRTRRVS